MDTHITITCEKDDCTNFLDGNLKYLLRSLNHPNPCHSFIHATFGAQIIYIHGNLCNNATNKMYPKLFMNVENSRALFVIAPSEKPNIYAHIRTD